MARKEIHNIFSSEKNEKIREIPNKKIPIIIDTREKQSLIVANLVEKNANIKFEKLDIGDYLVGEVAIERKTFTDFQSSIINKRLTQQLINLKKYKKSILIVEGFIYNYSDTIIHENAFRGMLLSSALDFQIPIIYSENEEDTANFLIVLARKQEKEKQEISLRQKPTEMSFGEQKQFILEGFPGVGPTTSKKLIETNRTLEKVFKLSKKELLDYLDEKRAEDFKRLLNR